MLYLLYGSEYERVREKSTELQQNLVAKRPTTSLFRYNSENFNQAEFKELVKAQGLFENRYVVVLDRAFDNADAKDFILKTLKDLKESPHIFILLQNKLDKASLAKIEKNAEKIQEFSSTKLGASSKDKFNIFSLTDALAKKDKRRLWILYQTARTTSAPEEIHGLLWWKVKTMLASSRGGVFSINDLKIMAARLVSIYHDAHRGLFEFDLALEKFILEI